MCSVVEYLPLGLPLRMSMFILGYYASIIISDYYKIKQNHTVNQRATTTRFSMETLKFKNRSIFVFPEKRIELLPIIGVIFGYHQYPCEVTKCGTMQRKELNRMNKALHSKESLEASQEDTLFKQKEE